LDYRLTIEDVEIRPFLNLAWVDLNVDSMVEGDQATDLAGGSAVLRSPSRSQSSSFLTVGTHGMAPLLGTRLQLIGMVGWRRTIHSDNEVDMRFGNGGADAYVTGSGVPLARDVFVADLGLSYALGSHTRVVVDYAGQIGNEVRDRALQARLIWTLE
jgi:outer membrane autotransporter protein